MVGQIAHQDDRFQLLNRGSNFKEDMRRRSAAPSAEVLEVVSWPERDELEIDVVEHEALLWPGLVETS